MQIHQDFSDDLAELMINKLITKQEIRDFMIQHTKRSKYFLNYKQLSHQVIIKCEKKNCKFELRFKIDNKTPVIDEALFLLIKKVPIHTHKSDSQTAIQQKLYKFFSAKLIKNNSPSQLSLYWQIKHILNQFPQHLQKKFKRAINDRGWGWRMKEVKEMDFQNRKLELQEETFSVEL